jgi:hypothetical protein
MSEAAPIDITAWMPRSAASAPAPRRGSIALTLLVWLGGGIAGVAFGVAGIAQHAADVLLLLLGVVIALWLQVLVHEAGHALAGLARGMHLIAIGLGPWRLEQARRRWRVRRASAIAGVGGFALLSPAAGRVTARRDHVVYLLGGPLANLISAAAVAPWLSVDVAPALLGLGWGSVGFGLLFGAVNLWPFRSGGWRTDGLSLLQLWRKPAETRAELQLMALMGLALAGVRPRDWDATQIPTVEPEFDPLLRRSLELTRLGCAIDAGRDEEAGVIAASIAADYASAPDGLRQNQALLMASFAARCAHSEALLAAWLPLADGGLLDMQAQREWLQAELATLRGASDQAHAHLARARAALPHVHDAASADQLGDYLDALQRRLQATTSAPAVASGISEPG